MLLDLGTDVVIPLVPVLVTAIVLALVIAVLALVMAVLALVKAINFVGIADTSPKRNHRSRRRKRK